MLYDLKSTGMEIIIIQENAPNYEAAGEKKKACCGSLSHSGCDHIILI